MRLVACPTCHTQYDVTHVIAESFRCRCGAGLESRGRPAVDAPQRRCGSCGALVQAGSDLCEYCRAELAVDLRDLSLICPECFARNAEASRFCTACGVAFRPEPVLVEGHELPCPACAASMPPRQFLGLALNECPRCNGLWVPEPHLEALVQRAIQARASAGDAPVPKPAPRVRGANPAAQSVHYRRCPECDVLMQRRNFRKSSGVITDVCGEHGTWLDPDELEQIAGFLLSGGETSPLLQGGPELPAAARAALARLAAGAAAPPGRDGGSAVGSLLDVLTRLFA